MFQNKSLLKVFIFVHFGIEEYSGVEKHISLLVCLSQSFIFAFFEVKELVFHVNTLFIFDYDDLIIRIVSFILESTKFFNIDLFIRKSFIVHLQAMQAQLFSIFKRNKLFSQAILVITNIMRYFVMYFQTVIIFVISILFLFSTYIAQNVLYIYMASKLIFIKEVFAAETAVRMHECYITEFVNISLLKMFV